jgi:nucleotide-binding universal stress UspA family protein
MYRRILVAVENSPADQTILAHVSELARLTGAALLLVHVADGWVARKLTRTDEQKRFAESYIAQLTADRVYSHPIVTKVQKLDAFYPAEAYHQDYVKNYPSSSYVVMNDLPKLARLKKDFPSLCRAN